DRSGAAARAAARAAAATATARPAARGDRSERRARLARSRDRSDAFLEELVILVLEGDHDLWVVMERVDLGLERLRRAQRERDRDHAIDPAGPEWVVNEWVQNDVLQPVVDQVGAGQGVGRRPECSASAAAAGATSTSPSTSTATASSTSAG